MVYPATMSCSRAPDACRLTAIDGTATLTMELSITAISCPIRTMASTRPGRTDRVRLSPGARRVLARAGHSVSSVMALSLRRLLCCYQEPGYPGIDTTRKPWRRQEGSRAGDDKPSERGHPQSG